MSMRWIAVVVSSLGFLLSEPSTALACACCADPGYRREDTQPLDAYGKGELGRLRFANLAQVYQGPAEDSIKGIAPASIEYWLTSTLKGSVMTWKLVSEAGNGNDGTLTLTLPPKVDRFYADVHDTKPNQETQLYKEWRFSTKLTATGVFKAGLAKGTKATLVLQGRGNHCDDAEMFTHWTLIVKGPKADYTLYGALKKPA